MDRMKSMVIKNPLRRGLVLGQLTTALVIDHFGLFASPSIKINLARSAGVLLVALGAYLVGR
jgi:uncharacterized membrane protein YdcZ (DUF606 family)